MSRKKGILKRLSKSEMERICHLEDAWLESIVESDEFRKGVSYVRDRLLNCEKQLPELLRVPGHHCTLHRGAKEYAHWDMPIDQLCDQYGLDKGFDLAYGPRYMIERHILFDEPVGNLPHPLIRCETDTSPVPHIAKISILPPSKSLSADELNWLLLDVEFLIIDREPVYPFSPTEAADLFGDLKGEPASRYKERVEQAVKKRIITDPVLDPHALVELIEFLKDEQGLNFKEVGYVLDISEGAVRKRYVRATHTPSGESLWIPPTPRKMRHVEN